MSTISYAIIGSGSSANCYYIEYEGEALLIDNGFTFKELSRRADALGLDLEKVRGVFVSHSHSDHMKGVGVLMRKLSIPVYLHHAHPQSVIPGKCPIPPVPVTPGRSLTLGPFLIEPYETSHDAAHSINFHVTAGGRSLMVLTDSGQVTEAMKSLIARTDILFLEANYEEQMLVTGPYPYYLKQRIASVYGHLSNSDALSLIGSISGNSRPSRVYLCHMSDTNNRADLLEGRVARELDARQDIHVCRKGSMHAGLLETDEIVD